MLNFVNRFPLRDADPAPGGGGAGAPPGFDMAAFKAELLGEIRKDLNGIAKSLKTDILKAVKPAEGSPPADPTADPQTPGSPPIDPKQDPVLNAELVKLRREMAARDKKVDELIASNTSKDAAIKESNRLSAFKTAVDEISFKDANSKNLFFKANVADIVYDDDGQVVAKTADGLITVSEYVKSQASLTPSLLAPVGGGGAGAKGGGNPGGINAGLSFSKDLKPEDIAKWTAQQTADNMQKVLNGQLVA